MADRPRFFDDLAGVAGGAFSAFSGLRDEAESTIRARVDEVIRKLDLVKREELDAVQEMAAAAREGQERAEARLAALETRLAALESRPAATSASQPAHASASASAHATATTPEGAEAPPAANPSAFPPVPPAVD